MIKKEKNIYDKLKAHIYDMISSKCVLKKRNPIKVGITSVFDKDLIDSTY